MNNEQELVEISKDTDEDLLILDLLAAVNQSTTWLVTIREFEKLNSFFELVGLWFSELN